MKRRFEQVFPPRAAVWLVFLILWATPVSGQMVLNEIMADNRTALRNETEFPDWVELYNGGPAAVDLGGWTLTDNLGQPAKFVFPTGTMVPTGQSLVVFCDSSFALPGFHTGFGLDNKGELVALYAPSNPFAPLDVVSFGLQAGDYSIGRVPDCTGGWQLNTPTPGAPNAAAALAASTNLFINEWMAVTATDWLELFNVAKDPVALSGLVWTDSLSVPDNRAIALLSFIGPEGFIQFFADDLAQSAADHLDFKLSSSGETITLYESDRVTPVGRVVFGAQTANVSQGRLPDGDTNVVFFPAGRDTPGASNFLPLTNVVVNEVLAHTDPPLEDAIELANLSSVSVDISYWWLSNSKNTPRKFQIPPPTILPAHGFKVFYENQFNPDRTGNAPSFTLNSARGDETYLFTGDQGGRLTGFRGGVAFGPTQNGISLGRYATSVGEVEFVPMSRRTFGADTPATVEEFRTGTGRSNAPPLVGPLVINEIMFHPPDLVSGDDNTKDEYVEILNLTNSTTLLYDPEFPTNRWRVAGGVEFTFPSTNSLAGGAILLLVNFNPDANPTQLAAFRAKYHVPLGVSIYGPYSGKLDNRAGTVSLFKPDKPQAPDRPDAGLVPYILVERVKYEDRSPWPDGADGTGLALQRFRPESFGNDPGNWVATEPTPGAELVRIEATALRGNEFVFRFRRVAGRSYTVQYRHSLSAGDWLKWGDFGAQNVTELCEVSEAVKVGQGARFYRIVSPIQP